MSLYIKQRNSYLFYIFGIVYECRLEMSLGVFLPRDCLQGPQLYGAVIGDGKTKMVRTRPVRLCVDVSCV